jgi:hypothetical protein
VLKEAGAILTESEKPLGYAATVVTILGVAAAIAYLLTQIGIKETEAIAFGLLSALLGLAVFYLAVALRRGSRSAAVVKSAQDERIGHQAAVAQLESQLATVRRETADERTRLQGEVAARDARIATLTQDLAEARRIAEEERRSTERAKVSPAMDPFYRFEGHLISQDHYWVGVENKGLGPAENVTLLIDFKSDTEAWAGTGKPYLSVLEKGEKKEFEMAASHFNRNPKELGITVEYDDLTGLHHSKGVKYSLR